MSRLFGIFLVVACLYLLLIGCFDAARSVDNHLDLARRLGFYGVLTLGAGILIVSGGIDLSIGSLVGLAAVSFGLMLEREFNPWLAAGLVLTASAAIGVVHGTLVTRLKLQPFLVTLCGLFIYRGLARWVSKTTVGLAVEAPDDYRSGVLLFVDIVCKGRSFGIPHILWLLLAATVILGLFLHATVFGRYLAATGSNEQASLYSGIPTRRYKILAYVICAFMAGLGGVLFLPMYGSANPASAGALLELYAITGAVLGGCSLRGGEGTVPGMLLGAAVLPLLNKLCNLSDHIGSDLEYAVIGAALLAGTIFNEVLARRQN